MIRNFDEVATLLQKKMPILTEEKLYVGPFYFTQRQKIKRIGGHYQKGQSSEHDECFIYLIEIFPKEKLKEMGFSDFKRNEWDGKEILKGYIPDFGPARNLIENVGKWVSWKEENELHSLILVQDNPAEKLREYFRLIQNSKEISPELEIFDFLQYFPKKVGDLVLEGMVIGVNLLEADRGRHLVKHLQGNYGVEGKEKWLNLELRFGCATEKVKKILKRIPQESSLKDETSVEIDGKELKLKTIQNFKNQREVKAFFWFDEMNRYTLIVHNNRTTEFDRYRDEMEKLVEAGLKSLDDYSLLERTTERTLPEGIKE